MSNKIRSSWVYSCLDGQQVIPPLLAPALLTMQIVDLSVDALKHLRSCGGVYVAHDNETVFYVGKAKHFRERVCSWKRHWALSRVVRRHPKALVTFITLDKALEPERNGRFEAFLESRLYDLEKWAIQFYEPVYNHGGARRNEVEYSVDGEGFITITKDLTCNVIDVCAYQKAPPDYLSKPAYATNGIDPLLMYVGSFECAKAVLGQMALAFTWLRQSPSGNRLVGQDERQRHQFEPTGRYIDLMGFVADHKDRLSENFGGCSSWRLWFGNEFFNGVGGLPMDCV